MREILFSFQGRMRRSEWWAVRIGSVVVGALTLAVIVGIATAISGGNEDVSLTLIGTGFLLAFPVFIWVNLAAATKRLHDQDMSGWIGLLVVVPYIGGLFGFVVLGCLDGTKGSNRYGLSPKYAEQYTAKIFE
jgi:uncharacterized membrane protein YhaH (DUF805 family)